MRQARILVFAIVVGVIALSLAHAFAQSPPAPGSGHGFLIDKHVAAGLNCSACHAESPPSKAPDSSACIKCHGSYADVAAKTAQDQPNPHASHLGQIPCTSCHHVHQASQTYCAQCHNFDMNTP
ncbi:MAG: cytochrome c3 family protein [Xanthobacteraceae bacterium]